MKKIFTTFALSIATIGLLQAQVARTVLIEEFTGTWCPNCPDGHTILKGIETANPGKTIVVGMHNGDAYTIPYQIAIENAFAVSGFPRAAIDRIAYSGGNFNVMSRGFWADAVAVRLNVSSPVEIKMNAIIDAATRIITTRVDYTFKADVSEETRLTCVLLEDSIIANQSGGSANYVHMDVCRALLSSDNWGDANNGATVTNGQSFSKVYTYTVPANMNINNLRAVAFINKKIGTTPTYGTGTEVLNAQEAKVSVVPLSIISNTKNNANIACTPNPFSTITAINFDLKTDAVVNAYVSDMRGVMIKQLINENRIAGNHTIYWGGTSSNSFELPNGLYFINVIANNYRTTKSVLLQR